MYRIKYKFNSHLELCDSIWCAHANSRSSSLTSSYPPQTDFITFPILSITDESRRIAPNRQRSDEHQWDSLKLSRTGGERAATRGRCALKENNISVGHRGRSDGHGDRRSCREHCGSDTPREKAQARSSVGFWHPAVRLKINSAAQTNKNFPHS